MPSFRLYLGHAAAAQFNPNATVYAVGHQLGVELGAYTVTAIYNPFPDGWDATDYVGDVSFSDGDKTATSAEDNSEVLSTTIHDSGKFFAEVEVDALTGYWFTGFSIGNTTSGSVALGLDGTVTVYTSAGFHQFTNLFPDLVDGDIVGCAIDIDRGKVWFRVNGGDWNNDPTQGPD